MTRSVSFNLKSIIYNFKSTNPGFTHASPRLRRIKVVSPAFTIVELLVVIVVIGILAAITIVSYTGISSRAVVSSLQSDLGNSSRELKLYHIDNSGYPTGLNGSNCPTGPSDGRYCLKPSPGNTLTYTPGAGSSPQTFTLCVTNTNGTKYCITDSSPAEQFDPNWIEGIAATVLDGKYVRNANLGVVYMFKTVNTQISSPQGEVGLDPNYPTATSLVSPQANPGVDFSDYPAQNACKAIGGRLANMQELLAVYTGRATYGNNFGGDYYWSSTEPATLYDKAYFHAFGANVTSDYLKNSANSNLSVRCVKD